MIPSTYTFIDTSLFLSYRGLEILLGSQGEMQNNEKNLRTLHFYHGSMVSDF